MIVKEGGDDLRVMKNGVLVNRVFSKEKGCRIGYPKSSALSKGLMVNSSLTRLDLGLSLLLNMIN